MMDQGLDKPRVKFNNSNYHYKNASMASKGRVFNEGKEAYSAFANPKGRTVYMAGEGSICDKPMDGHVASKRKKNDGYSY